ncbi:MAG TPA: efflux RND transporter permease subunit [Alphaproteobacteria bacterium]|jgi:multidrug efflux pump|nr:efflux RND transporter permease subunit [Alphaproteobacteria bacterium]
MTLPELSIRRPVFATVLSLLVTLVGLISYQRLTVREYPNIDEPVISVDTTYQGASAEIVESQITVPLEDSLAGIEGIDILTSISRAERSQINVRFRLNRDPDGAAADVRDRVGRVRGQLPDAIDEPIISKVEADAQPILYLAFSSDRHSPLEVTDYADRYVKDQLQNLPGVAGVRIFGERRYAMRIWLDPARLAGYGLTTQDVEDALRKQNVEIPSGRIESRDREFTVLTQTDLKTPAQFNNIVLRDAAGYSVRLSDVGRAEIDARDKRVIVRFNGNSAVAIGVIKQATANPLDVSKEVAAVLPRILASAPEGMRIDVAYDSSIFIDRSIDNVFHTIGEALVLVALVIFFFLRSLRATLIPLVTIPVSLVGAFAMMLLFGFSINTLTLLAMVLAIGLVVDDAIVMLENISRYVEQGMKPIEAALKGSREIAFAIVAMTITLAAVYMPVAFQTGRTGRLFGEFALTLAGAVLVSGFVALSLSPMMGSRLLRHETRHGLFYRVVEAGIAGLTRGYRGLLARVLNARGLVVVAVLAVAGAAFVLFRMLPSELAPVEDRGTVLSIGIAPEGSTIDFTERYARRIEEFARGVPDVEKYFLVVGFPVVNQAIAFFKLKDWSQRSIKQQDVVRGLQPKLFGIPGILGFPMNPPSLGQSPIDKPVQFVLQTSAPYSELQKAVDQLMAAARANPSLVNLDSDLKLNKPELRVDVDRDKAADLGIPVESIGRTLETMLGGRQVTRFKQNGKQYDVVVQVSDEERLTPAQLTRIYVRAKSGQMVPLSNLVSVAETVAPRELNHFNKLRSATITATLAPGYALGEALAFLKAEADKLPANIVNDLAGQSREFRTSSGGLYVTFVLALFFIYLVLSAQFESFIDPLIIMLTVPLSMAGALLALELTDGSLNVYSQIGLVTLVGLITKHGILIVEFANQLQLQGRSRRDAVIEAAVLRLRPILMTTGAMVLGSVPLALATGAGAESRQQIGWVVVGGLLLGTALTLFVVPTAYTLLARRRAPAATPAAAPELTAGHPAE